MDSSKQKKAALALFRLLNAQLNQENEINQAKTVICDNVSLDYLFKSIDWSNRSLAYRQTNNSAAPPSQEIRVVGRSYGHSIVNTDGGALSAPVKNQLFNQIGSSSRQGFDMSGMRNQLYRNLETGGRTNDSQGIPQITSTSQTRRIQNGVIQPQSNKSNVQENIHNQQTPTRQIHYNNYNIAIQEGMQIQDIDYEALNKFNGSQPRNGYHGFVQKEGHNFLQFRNNDQNSTRLTHMKKISMRAASEPPYKSGKPFNSKSIIPPVKEDEKAENDDCDALQSESLNEDGLKKNDPTVGIVFDELNMKITSKDLKKSILDVKQQNMGASIDLTSSSRPINNRSDINNFLLAQGMQSAGGSTLLSQQRNQKLTTHLLQQIPHISALSSYQMSEQYDLEGQDTFKLHVQQARGGRRQYSQGPNIIQVGTANGNRIQIASNQVYAAYGDPRDFRFTQQAQGLNLNLGPALNLTPGISLPMSGKMSTHQDAQVPMTESDDSSKTDQNDDSDKKEKGDAPNQKQQHQSPGYRQNKFGVPQIKIENFQTSLILNKQFKSENINKSNITNDIDGINYMMSKSPVIPKLNLVNINQDSKYARHKLETSIAHQGNFLVTSGTGPGILTTPGPNNTNIGGMTFINFAPPPLTSHQPILTSCSPEKRIADNDQVFYCMDTSNRTNAIIPLKLSAVPGGVSRVQPGGFVSSFQNPNQNKNVISQESLNDKEQEDHQKQMQKVGQQNFSSSGPTHGMIPTGNETRISQKQKQGQTFKQQKEAMMIKIKKIQTQRAILRASAEFSQEEQNEGGNFGYEAEGGEESGAFDFNNLNNRRDRCASLRLIDNVTQSHSVPYRGSQTSNVIPGFRVQHNNAILTAGRAITAEGSQMVDGLIQGNHSHIDASTVFGNGFNDYGIKMIQNPATLSLQLIGKQLGETFFAKDIAATLSQKAESDLWKQAEHNIYQTNQFPDKKVQKIGVAPRCKSMFILGDNSSNRNTKELDNLMLSDDSVSDHSVNQDIVMDQVRALKDDKNLSIQKVIIILSDIINILPLSDLNEILTESPVKALLKYIKSQRVQDMFITYHRQFKQKEFGVEQKNNPALQELTSLSKIISKIQLTAEQTLSKFTLTQFQGEDSNIQRGAVSSPSRNINILGREYDMSVDSVFARLEDGQLLPKEIIRKQADPLLWNLSKQIKSLIVQFADEQLGNRHASAGGTAVSDPTPTTSPLPTPLINKQINWLQTKFAQELTQLVISYRLSVSPIRCPQMQSRCRLLQILDSSTEAFLMIKRVLIEIVTIHKIFEIDFASQILRRLQVEFFDGEDLIDGQLELDDDHFGNLFHSVGTEGGLDMQIKQVVLQKIYKTLFIEFMNLLSDLYLLPQSPNSIKLLNELFVVSSPWQTVIQSFSFSMCRQEIVSPLIVGYLLTNSFKDQNNSSEDFKDEEEYMVELCILFKNMQSELGSVCLINFEESSFRQKLEFLDKQTNNMLDRYSQVSQISIGFLKELFTDFRQLLSYPKAILKFLKKAQDFFFLEQRQTSTGPSDKAQIQGDVRSQRPNDTTNYRMGINLNQSSFTRDFSPVDFGVSTDLTKIADNNQSVFDQQLPQSDNPFCDKNLISEQKYWKNGIRKALSQISYWLNPDFEFLKLQNEANQEQQSTSIGLYSFIEKHSSEFQMKQNKDGNFELPLSIQVCSKALQLLRQVFDMNQRFTKYLNYDTDLTLVYLRVHYTSFVRLYISSTQLLLEKIQLQNLDLSSDQIDQNLKSAIYLSKVHIKCLYALARQRSEEMRQTIATFGIFDFISGQLNLEHEYKASRKKYQQMCKQILADDTKKSENLFTEISSPFLPKNNQGLDHSYFDQSDIKLGFSWHNSDADNLRNQQQNLFQNQDDFSQRNQKQETFQKEHGYILNPTYQAQPQINQEIKKRIILKQMEYNATSHIDQTHQIPEMSEEYSMGDDLARVSTSIKGETQKFSEQNENVNESAGFQGLSDSDSGLPPPLPSMSKSMGFKIQIGGLKLSSLAQNDNGQTPEQIEDKNILKQEKAKNSLRSEPSDSDDGLPPPLPVISQNKRKLFGLKLQISGLGLSTIAADASGLTSEQLADQKTLIEQKKQKNQSSSDSDDGLPPPIIIPKQNKPNFKLSIGGLGLSTVTANDKGLTPEQMDDQKTLIQAKQQKSVSSESDSDDGLPPPLPVKSTNQKIKLNIGGLGLSNLAKGEGGQTAEQMADLQMLQEAKSQLKKKQDSSDSDQSEQKNEKQQSSDSDEGLPAPIYMGPPKKTFGFKLQIGGLGLSTVAKNDNEKTAEQIADIQALNEAKKRKKSSSSSQSDNEIIQENPTFGNQDQGQNHQDSSDSDDGLPPPIIEKKPGFGFKLPVFGLGLSTLAKGDDGKTAEQIADLQQLQESKQVKKQQSSSDSDSDLGLPPPIISQQSKKPSFSLKIGGLGLSTVVQDGQKMTQEQLADAQTLVQSKQKPKEINSDSSSSDYQNEGGDNSQSYGFLSGQKTLSDTKKTKVALNKIKINPLKLNIVTNQDQASGEVKSSAKIKISKKGQPVQNPLDPQTQIKDTQNELLSQKRDTKKVVAFDQNVDQIDHTQNQTVLSLRDTSARPALPSGKSINKQQHFEISENLQRTKTTVIKKKKPQKLSKEEFYQQERDKRPVYIDRELHSLMISLVLCLLLQPQRGTLDQLYCNQYPINNGKTNYLFILHQHLANKANGYVVSKLQKEIGRVQPPLAMQRLLKLMCPQLFDLSLYSDGKNWRKLAVGAYGTVYECFTSLSTPSVVAIKQMDLPVDMFDRCVLHDIFTEITCLEEFRLEKCVTDLYDYGVDEQSYYIVMKKYTCSLGEWRRRQGSSVEEFRRNLKLYVQIYSRVLKALKVIHSHKVTHYDIKCDNVLIDFKNDRGGELNLTGRDYSNLQEDDFEITIGDFGECKIFWDEKDELCTRNRGTDSIKSPEMLQLAINTRKDHEKYDRRKQVGTNRLSDVWSIGCLFYELCTGEFLFYDPDFAYFFCRVVANNQELITQKNFDRIDQNQYIRDFLKFVLARDQRLRPTIDKVIKRFDLIHALLCNLSDVNPENDRSQIAIENFGNYQLNRLDKINLIDSYPELVRMLQDILAKRGSNKIEQILKVQKQKHGLLQIVENVYLGEIDFKNKMQSLMKLVDKYGISHIIMIQPDSEQFKQELSQSFNVHFCPKNYGCSTILAPSVMDYLRKVVLLKGRIVFLEELGKSVIKEVLLLCLNHLFKTSLFQTYTLVKAQTLLFHLESKRLKNLSDWSLGATQAHIFLQSYPQYSCHCGACLIILDRQHSQLQNQVKLLYCNCSKNNKRSKLVVQQKDFSNDFNQSVDQSRISETNYQQKCPCSDTENLNCSDYINFLNKYYYLGRASMQGTHIQMQPINELQKGNQDDHVLWGFFEIDDFIIGPQLKEQQTTSVRLETPMQLKIPVIPLSALNRNFQQQTDSLSRRSKQSINTDGLLNNQNLLEIASNISQSITKNSTPVIPFKVQGISSASIDRIESQRDDKGNSEIFMQRKVEKLKITQDHGLKADTSILGLTPEQKQKNMQSNDFSQKLNNLQNQWQVYKCNICQCWTHAHNSLTNKFAIILNNRLKTINEGLYSIPRATQELNSYTLGQIWPEINGVQGMAHKLDVLDREFLIVRAEHLRRIRLQKEVQELEESVQDQMMTNRILQQASGSNRQAGAIPAAIVNSSSQTMLARYKFQNRLVPSLGNSDSQGNLTEEKKIQEFSGRSQMHKREASKRGQLSISKQRQSSYQIEREGHMRIKSEEYSTLQDKKHLEQNKEGIKVPVLVQLSIQLPF